VRHLAAESGIAVVTVPARGTSRHCPVCLTVLRHRKAPDGPPSLTVRSVLARLDPDGQAFNFVNLTRAEFQRISAVVQALSNRSSAGRTSAR